MDTVRPIAFWRKTFDLIKQRAKITGAPLTFHRKDKVPLGLALNNQI